MEAQSTDKLDALRAEIIRVKRLLPFRIVWGYVAEDGTLQVTASHNMRAAKKAAKEGHQVYTV